MRRILAGYGRGQQPLPVYKMPHLRGWAVAGRHAYLPAIGRHEVLVVDTETWQEVGRIPVAGQPVFVIARPDGRQVWVNFAVPDYDRVQVIDTLTQRRSCKTLEPGKAVLHMEFTPRGEAVWISSRDDNRVSVIDTAQLRHAGHAAARCAERHLLHQPRRAAWALMLPRRSRAWTADLLNGWQRGFPLVAAPFARIARRARRATKATVIAALRGAAARRRAQPHRRRVGRGRGRRGAAVRDGRAGRSASTRWRARVSAHCPA